MTKKLLCIIVFVLTCVCILASCANNKTDISENPTHTHNYGEWEITKVAGCTEEGAKERYCSCGDKQTSTIAKTEHNYVEGVCSSCGNKNSQQKTDEAKYNEACALIEDGNYEEAYKILKEISSYAPARGELENFFYAPTQVKEGAVVYYTGSYLPSMEYDTKVYSYDTNGNIVSITIAESDKTYNFTYDSKGNELQGYPVDTPDSWMGDRTCIYNRNGQLIKISYSDISQEYFYNSDGTVSKMVYSYQAESFEEPRISEAVYTYTYYNNGTVKTMRYVDIYDREYEYQYNTDGAVTEIGMYCDDFSEKCGYYSLTYGIFGIEKVEIWNSAYLAYLQGGIVGEIVYTYNAKGLLTEVMHYSYIREDELVMTYLLSDYVLCYSENDNAKKRIDIISYVAPERIVEYAY